MSTKKELSNLALIRHDNLVPIPFQVKPSMAQRLLSAAAVLQDPSTQGDAGHGAYHMPRPSDDFLYTFSSVLPDGLTASGLDEGCLAILISGPAAEASLLTAPTKDRPSLP